MKKREASERRNSYKKKEAKEKVKSKAFAKADAKRSSQKKTYLEGLAKRSGMFEGEPGESATGSGRRAVSKEKTEKAYKLVAVQESISNAQGKGLIDRGLVYVGNKKVMIARGELPLDTTFIVQQVETAKKIFENDDLIVVDKPAFLNADEIERQYPDARLLHRLDRETSGVLMLVKNEEFREKAIKAFRDDEVYKEYVAWIEGVFIDEIMIDKPIITEKRGNKAYSKVSKNGKPARSEVYPVEVNGKRSKVKIIIHEGRTHQIRTHLRSVNFPIVGDEMYGGKRNRRVMLHAKKVTLLGMTFEAKEPKVFAHFST